MTQQTIYQPELVELIRSGVASALERMRASMPGIGEELAEWAARLTRGEGEPAFYFMHPEAFPLLFLPWQMEVAIQGKADRERQALYIEAAVHGYYFVRLIDNVMDHEEGPERRLLAAAGYFMHRFERACAVELPPGHPFWAEFEPLWFGGLESAIRDAGQSTVDEQGFLAVAARKVYAGRLPLASLAHIHNRPDAGLLWARLHDRLGAWHQLQNDLFDAARDEQRGIVTWVTSEAQRCRRSEETMLAWIAREGFAWGLGVLDGWMRELQKLAADLGSPDLLRYLEWRDSRLRRRAASLKKGMEGIATLFALAEGTS